MSHSVIFMYKAIIRYHHVWFIFGATDSEVKVPVKAMKPTAQIGRVIALPASSSPLIVEALPVQCLPKARTFLSFHLECEVAIYSYFDTQGEWKELLFGSAKQCKIYEDFGECTVWISQINYATTTSLLFNTDYTGNKSVLTLWDLKSTWIMYQAFRPYFAILFPLRVTKTNIYAPRGKAPCCQNRTV